MRYLLLLVFSFVGNAVLFSAPPVANPDEVRIQTQTRPVEITGLLSNDTDPDNDNLMIFRADNGAYGDVTLKSATTLVYSPHRDFEDTDTFTYYISDGSATTSATVTVRNPFVATAGTYSALFPGENATNANAGYLEIKTTTTGNFSAVVTVAGVRYRFKGGIELDGSVSATIGINLIELSFPLDAGAPKTIAGSIDPLGVQFSAPINPYSRTTPTPREGRYTVALRGPSGVPDIPKGTGFAAIRILDSGRATFRGRLGDNTTWTASTLLSAQGDSLPFYAIVRPTPSNVFGVISLQTDKNFVRANGDCQWLRAKDRNRDLYPKGFQMAVEIEGSNFRPPTVTEPILDVTLGGQNATFLATGGDLRKEKLEKATIGLRPAFGAYKIKLTNKTRIEPLMKVDPNTGIITGRFHKPATGAVRPFGGVVIQSLNIGVGVFEAVKNTGNITLAPNGASAE